MRLHILETTRDSTPTVPDQEFTPDESPSGWVFLQQQPLVIADVRREDRWPEIMQLLLRNNIVTLLAAIDHRAASAGALVFGFGFRLTWNLKWISCCRSRLKSQWRSITR